MVIFRIESMIKRNPDPTKTRLGSDLNKIHLFFRSQYAIIKILDPAGKTGSNLYTVCHCPGSSDPFYVVTYYINWVTTSWTHSIWI